MGCEPDPLSNEFGKMLKRRRGQLGITQGELGRRFRGHVGQAAVDGERQQRFVIARWERGGRIPQGDAPERLLDLLQVREKAPYLEALQRDKDIRKEAQRGRAR